MNAVMATLAELLRAYLNIEQATSEIIAAAIIFAIAIVVCWIGYSVFEKYVSKWAKKTKTRLDDEILRNIKAPIFLLAILVGTYYSLESLTMLQPYSDHINSLFAVAEILMVTFIITRVSNVLVSWYAEKSAKGGRRVSNHILFILKKVIQAAVYLFAFLTILVVFKIDLSGVVVGLGVGGIAIALALQSLLSDAFSAFSIYFDRPFEIGDFIIIGEYAGTVTKIGMKSTRLQLLQGEELIISNRELTTAKVRNFKKLKKRRITFKLGVTCDTSLEKLRKIPDIISKILQSIELAELGTVYFTKIGDFSLDFEVVYYVKTPDYGKYLDTQQKINYAILEAFEKESIKTAYPTQTIFINKDISE